MNKFKSDLFRWQNKTDTVGEQWYGFTKTTARIQCGKIVAVVLNGMDPIHRKMDQPLNLFAQKFSISIISFVCVFAFGVSTFEESKTIQCKELIVKMQTICGVD